MLSMSLVKWVLGEKTRNLTAQPDTNTSAVARCCHHWLELGPISACLRANNQSTVWFIIRCSLGFARWYVIIPSFVYVIISNNHIAWYFYIEFYPILPECSCENRSHVAYGLNVNKHCAIRLQPKSCSNYRRAHQQQSQHGGCMSSVSQNHTSYVAGKTHLALDEMAAISQRTFSNAFSRTKSFDVMQRFVFWLKFHRSLFLRAQLTKLQHWFR